MPRPAVLLALSALAFAALAAALAAAPAAVAATGWSRSCAGSGAGRACLATIQHGAPNARGDRDGVTVVLRRHGSCHTLHVTFDSPIAAARPVSLAIDDGTPLPFYTETELTRLARAVDAGQAPDWGPSEFQGFFGEVRAGAVAKASAGTELVARFARLKDSRRLGLACAATARLLPALRRGRTLTLSFEAQPRAGAAVYHWPRLLARQVSVPLEGVLASLDSDGESR